MSGGAPSTDRSAAPDEPRSAAEHGSLRGAYVLLAVFVVGAAISYVYLWATLP